MSELVTTRIRATAAKLGLPHLTQTLTEYVQRADTAQMGYLDFPGLVLEEELAVREERRLRHALRISKMPHHKTLDDYDFSYQPELDPRKVRDLATLAFAGAKANAALLGPPRAGKTHIAVALAVAACRAGYTVCFTTLDDMARQLKAADAIARLVDAGVAVRKRYSTTSDQVTGYAVGLPQHTAKGGGIVWYGGGKLAADLTLPKLRRRWSAPARTTARAPDAGCLPRWPAPCSATL